MNDTTTNAVVSEIRAEMARQRLTVADLAERCALSVPQLNRRLTGTVELALADLFAIADGLGLTASALMARAESTKAAA